jgi:hypothetical protein
MCMTSSLAESPMGEPMASLARKQPRYLAVIEALIAAQNSQCMRNNIQQIQYSIWPVHV